MDHIPDRDLIDEIDRRLHERSERDPAGASERDDDSIEPGADDLGKGGGLSDEPDAEAGQPSVEE